MKVVVAIAVIAACTSQVSLSKETDTTWGKSGVNYEQYQADSVDCAYVGYYRDVSKDEPAVKFLTGWRAADNALNMPGGNGDGWGAAIARTQPDRRRAELHAIQTSDVENCLIRRGYREIHLTRSEVKRLAKYKRGSETRRHYLYSIAAR